MSQPAQLPVATERGAPPNAAAGESGAGEATVFISYSRRDMVFVDRLDAALRQRGIATLIDRTAIEIGEPWSKRLEDLIARAETVIFVLSPDSVKSTVCAAEVDFSRRLGKRIIPVVARTVADPSVPEVLAELNYVFLDDETIYEANVDRLVRAIRTDLAWMRLHADLGRSAQEWNKAGRSRGLLLGGARLKIAEQWIASRPANAPLPTDDLRDLIAASHSGLLRRRRGLVAALVAGLVVALGLAGLAYLQRREALAQRDAARRNFDLAREAADGVIFDFAQGLRQASGVRISTLRAILTHVEATTERLMRAAPEDAALQRTRLVMLNEFGDTYLAAGDTASAKTAYRAALDIARALVRRDPDKSQWQRDLAIGLFKDGDVKHRTGDAPGAKEAYRRSLGILRSLVGRAPDDGGLQRDLAAVLHAAGDLGLKLDEADDALVAHEEALAIRRALVRRDPDNTPWRRDLALSLERIGDLRLRSGDSAGAVAAFQESLDIRRALVARDPDNGGWQFDLAIGLDRIGDGKRRADDLPGALAAYQEAFGVRQALVRRDPENTAWQRDLAVSYERIGDAKVAADEATEALATYGESLDIRRALAKRDPDSVQAQTDLIVSLFKISVVTGVLERRRELLTEALEIASRLQKGGLLSGDQAKWPDLIRAELEKS